MIEKRVILDVAMKDFDHIIFEKIKIDRWTNNISSPKS